MCPVFIGLTENMIKINVRMHIFYCPDIYCSKVSIGRATMDYKEKIIELLDKVKTENTFKRVYKLLEYLYLKEK